MTKFDIHKAANELEDELQLKVANFTSHMNDEIDWRDKRIGELEDELEGVKEKLEKSEEQFRPGAHYVPCEGSRPAWERDAK